MENFNFKTRKMMNQATAELYHTTAYVEDYLDCIESLPNDLQRSVSQMREVDSAYRLVLKQMKQHYKDLVSCPQESAQRRKALFSLQRCLLRTQELGDEKLNLSSQIVETVENRLRQMDVNKGHVELSEKPKLQVENNKDKLNKMKREAEVVAEKSSKRLRRHKAEKDKEKEVPVATTNKENNNKSKKKKRTKGKVEREPSPIDIPIDPNEPTYCLCNQVSYGEMVGCDNKDCPYEWFHFGCVGLNHKPKGKWYCPKCLPEVKKK